jgi:hypothetical protein
MEPLYSHQKKIISEDKLKCGLFLGTGASKTRTALHLAEGNTLVICPKQQREDKTWERENEKWETGIKLTVISKEDIRKQWDTLPRYNTVIIDEAHSALGISPSTVQRKGVQYPKTSQIFEAIKSFLEKTKPKRLYFLSATPIPKPMSMWGLGILLGQNWDFFLFRNTYYTEIRIGGTRRVWIPKKSDDIKQRLANLVQRFGYTGSLNDFFDVPAQTHKVVEIPLSSEQKRAMENMTFMEADPLVRRARLRTIENGILYGKKVSKIDGK